MKVEEPLAAYGLTAQSLESDVELIRHARVGIKTSMFWDFLKAIKSSKSEFEQFLPYSLKTFSRKRVLDEEMGERVLNIMRVFKKGEDYFGDIEKFKIWIDRFNPFIGDKPKNFLTTSTGCQIIIDELGRAEHGIMA